jgi:hypothetical protein
MRCGGAGRGPPNLNIIIACMLRVQPSARGFLTLTDGILYCSSGIDGKILTESCLRGFTYIMRLEPKVHDIESHSQGNACQSNLIPQFSLFTLLYQGSHTI